MPEDVCGQRPVAPDELELARLEVGVEGCGRPVVGRDVSAGTAAAGFTGRTWLTTSQYALRRQSAESAQRRTDAGRGLTSEWRAG